MGRPTPEGVAAMAVVAANRATAAAAAATAATASASSSPPASHPPLTKEDTIAAHRLVRQETPMNHSASAAPPTRPQLTHADTINLSASEVAMLSPIVMLPTVTEADPNAAAAAAKNGPYSSQFGAASAPAGAAGAGAGTGAGTGAGAASGSGSGKRSSLDSLSSHSTPGHSRRATGGGLARPLSSFGTTSSAAAAPGASQADQLLSELASLKDTAPPASAPRFTKQLSSDLSPPECLALFLNLQTVSDLFVDFSVEELKALSAIFSVLRIPQGETIIRKGEEAEFCGIVLQGRFQAVISSTPDSRVELRAGNLLGEMSIFESMTRSADIVTAEDSVLAVLTFEELDLLGSQQAPLMLVSESSEAEVAGAAPAGAEDAAGPVVQDLGVLQTKLLKMFAVASIRKLRATTQQTTEALSKANAALAAATAASTTQGQTSSSAGPSAATAGSDSPAAAPLLELNKGGRSLARNTSVVRASMEVTDAAVMSAASSTNLPPLAATATPAATAAGTASTAAAGTGGAAESSKAAGTATITSPSASLDSAVAPTSVTSRESLYRVRLALEREKQSAHREAETERALRVKEQQRSQNHAAQFERFKQMSERLKSELQTHVARVAALTAEAEAARADQQKAQQALAQSIEEHDALYVRYSTEQSQRLAESKAALEAREALESQRDRDLATLRSELGQALAQRVDVELEMDRRGKESAAIRAAAAEQCAAAEASVAEAHAKLEAQSGAVAAAQRAQKSAEDSLSSLAATVAQQTASLHLSRQALEEKSLEIQRLLPFKPKCVELTAQLAREKKQSLQALSQMFAHNAALEARLVRYRKMLLVVTAACTVKLYRTKKAARLLHLEISATLCDILAGHLIAAGASSDAAQPQAEMMGGMDISALVAAAGASSGSGSGANAAGAGAGATSGASASVHVRTDSSTGSVVSEDAGSTSSSNGGPPGSSAFAASSALVESSLVLRKALDRKKKLYLESVMKRTRGLVVSNGTGSAASAALAGFRGSMSLSELIASIEEEVLKLRGPFEAVQERALHWRVTGEKFFARTVELTSVILELRKANAALALQNSTLQSLLDQHSAQQDGVLASNQALRMEVARFKSELGAARAAHKAAETERDVRGAKKREVEAMDSRIAMQQARLSFIQARYVETAEALQRLVAAAVPKDANDGAKGASGGLSALPVEPPPAGPHFPPVPPHVTTPTLTQLFASTLGIRFEVGAGVHTAGVGTASSKSFLPRSAVGAGSSTGIPASHEDPELYHSLSLQHFQAHEQQEMAMRELDKWRGVQFVLENSAAPAHRGKKGRSGSSSSSGAMLQPSRSQGRGVSRKSSPASSDPLVSSLSSLTEVSALRLRDNYASVREASDASVVAADEDSTDHLTGSPSRSGLQHSRAQEEEECKQSLLSSQTARIRLVKNAMGRSHALGDTSSLRSNNNFHSNLSSRNSTEINENGALTSVGSSPANAINGGAASPAAIAASMSSYSSFAPVATTSEASAPDYSRTLMLLKPFAATVATSAAKKGFGRGVHTATEGGGARDYAVVYASNSGGGAAAGFSSASSPAHAHAHAHPYPPPVPHSAASIHASAADLHMAPTGAYVHPTHASVAAWPSPPSAQQQQQPQHPLRASRAPGQFASATSLRGPDVSPSPRASRRVVVASGSSAKSTSNGGQGQGQGQGAAVPPTPQQPLLFPPLTPRAAQPILEQYFKHQQQLQQEHAFAQAMAAHMWQQQQQQQQQQAQQTSQQ